MSTATLLRDPPSSSSSPGPLVPSGSPTHGLLTPTPAAHGASSRPGWSRRRFGAAAAGVAGGGLLAAAGCGGDPDSPADAGGEVDEVTYVTGFGLSGRECYAHVAAAKGFFADAGIQVQIEAGKAGEYNHSLLAGGAAQFTAVDSSGAFVRYATGGDASFQITAAVQQKTLISLMALESSGIRNPADLEGKTVAGASGSVIETLFPAYAELAGFDPTTVNYEHAAPPQLPGLLAAGRADAVGLFVVGLPAVQAAAGEPVTALTYSDYIPDLLGTVIVTPKQLIADDPDLVRRFTNALMRGLEYAVDHPEEAGQILHEAVPVQDPRLAAAELELMRPYVLPAPGNPIGYIDDARTVRAIGLLQAVGMVPAGSDLVNEPEQIIAWPFVPGADNPTSNDSDGGETADE